MKTLKYFLSAIFIITAFISCDDEDFGSTDFVNSGVAPSNIMAYLNVTQDNTGLVTITPNGEGAVSYDVYYGDGTAEPVKVKQGQSTSHIYGEGTYSLKLVGYNLTGQKTEVTQDFVVSFRQPENLMVTIENDAAVSKKVNVTATADFGLSFDVYFGEEGNDTPVSANMGGTASYVYAEAGTYTIRVVAKSAAIATTEYVEEFEVTAILQPINSAPTPRARAASDVISIFSAAYENLPAVNYFPDWGQGGQGSSWAMFNLNGDDMLQYINLSYQGIDFGQTIDASGMEFLHLDVWTADTQAIEISAIRPGPDERPVTVTLVANEWNKIDIPLSDYTDQGLALGDLFQLKFVGTPWAASTVFIDNIYFYKNPTGVSKQMIQDFEGTAPTFTSFGNATTFVINNPDASGINTSANVAEIAKPNGAEVWAGSFFEVSSPLDFANYSKISVKTHSPKIGATVKLKLENAEATVTHEKDLTTTVANSWEELLYDFSDAPAADYVRIVIFFDFGNAGDGSVYYYDEVQLVDEGGASDLVFEDFEGAAPTFTAFGSAATTVITNPDQSGINTSANVVEFVKPTGAEIWAGSFFETAPLDFDNYTGIKVKTWSPKTGAVVKVKLENAEATVTHEIDVNTTVSNSWEELFFDFSAAPTAEYMRVVIFFDFGNGGDDSVYYYDDFTLAN